MHQESESKRRPRNEDLYPTVGSDQMLRALSLPSVPCSQATGLLPIAQETGNLPFGKNGPGTLKNIRQWGVDLKHGAQNRGLRKAFTVNIGSTSPYPSAGNHIPYRKDINMFQFQEIEQHERGETLQVLILNVLMKKSDHSLKTTYSTTNFQFAFK